MLRDIIWFRPTVLLANVTVLLITCLVKDATCWSPGEATQSRRLPVAAKRILNEPESVWIEFIQLALDHKPLNLGQGFPDFAAPQYLVDSLHNATKQDAKQDVANYNKLILNHQYTRSFGHPPLVKSLRRYYKQFRHFIELNDQNEQILVTVGAYEALFCALMAFVNPGDEVLIIDPAFDAYDPIVRFAGGHSVFVPLRRLNSSERTTAAFKIDLQELGAKISNRTRAIVLNTPNNPLGKVFSREELESIAQLCTKHNILVIADEVYEQFYYEPYEHISIATLPGMWDRTITIGSAGKTFSVTGWKIGWALGPAHLLHYLQLVHQTAIYTVATPLQEALARAFEHEMNLIEQESGNFYWSELRRDLVRKRDRMAAIFERSKMNPIVPQGGYFMLIDFKSIDKIYPEYKRLGLREPEASEINTNDYRFARWLSKVKHLQGIPGSAFYSDQNKHLASDLIRFCFIKDDKTLDKLDELMQGLISSNTTSQRMDMFYM